MNNKNAYSLTQPQRRIWLTQNIYPSSTMFNIGGSTLIEGNIDIEVMIKAMKTVIKTHDIFQVRLKLQDMIPIQYYVDEAPNVEYIDFSEYHYTVEEYLHWAESQAQIPFELYHNPLYYIAICKIKDNVYSCFGKFHHIIMDGWSFQLLLADIQKFYLKIKNGETFYDYLSESHWSIQGENKYLNSESYEKDRLFWMNMLKDAPQKIHKENYIDGMRSSYKLTEEKTSDIYSFCKKNRISVNSFFVSIYIMYVHKVLNQNTALIGIPMLGRVNKMQRATWGMFVNVMPFVFRIQENRTLIELMKLYDNFLIKGYVHQRYPYNHLVKDMEMNGALLYEVCVNYYKTDMEQFFDKYPISYHEFYNGQQIYALQIIIREWTGGKTLQIDFDTLNAVYNKNDVEALYSHFMNIIDFVLQAGNKDVSSLKGVNYDRPLLNRGFNNTYKKLNTDATVIDLFIEQVMNTPDRIAAECNGERVTYRELYMKSQEVRAFLQKSAILQSSVIGVLTEHSLETLYAIWGILLYGSAFLLIDSQTPYGRIDFMLNDANAKVLLTNIYLDEKFKWSGIICKISDIYGFDNHELIQRHNISTSSMAYVMYTSGTTGRPKGVLITHGNLFNYVCWAKSEYANQTEIFALFSSLACDLTITSIFIPTISGGKIIIYPNDQKEYSLFKVIEDNRCTVVKLTPSHLSLIQNFNIQKSSIKRFIVGGEELKTKLVQQILNNFGEDIEVINEYGPTEATVGCMICRYDKKWDMLSSVPIGKPAWNTQIYILDDNYKAVPCGVQGNLYISGAGVSNGYLNRPELTDERFTYITIEDCSRRLYDTGDRAKFIDDNTLMYCGRRDMQVKINGYRVELMEIEHAMEQFPGIASSCVVLLSTDQNEDRLCAYYQSENEIHEELLRNYLLEMLPKYMIPSWFVWLKDIELTQNGKWKKSSLPRPSMYASESIQDNNENDILLKVSADILNLKTVNYNDNYYHVGGDSIKAIQISSKLREKGYLISIKDILNNPEFSKMNQLMIHQNAISSAEQKNCSGEILTTPIIKWFFAQKFIKPETYCQEVHLTFTRHVSGIMLKKVQDILIKHHDILRLNIHKNKQLFYNKEHLDGNYIIEEFNFDILSDNELEQLLQEQSSIIKNSMDMESKILFRSYLVHTGKSSIWCLIAHHLLVDGMSWQILLKDIDLLLTQMFQGQNFCLPEKTVSYQEWAETIYKMNLKLWEPIAIKRNEKKNTSFGITVMQEFDAEFTKNLLKQANVKYGTKPVELILSGLICSVAEQKEFFPWILEVEHHGRQLVEEMDISETVGWFTQFTYNKISHLPTKPADIIIWCKEMYRNMHHDTAVFVEDNDEEMKNVKTIRFNYMGSYQSNYKIFEVKPVYFGDYPMTGTLEFDGIILQDKLTVYLRLEETICSSINCAEKFLKSFIRNMHNVLELCLQEGERQLTPSDFPDAQLSQDELNIIFQ